MSVASRIGYVATLVWVVVMGILVPGYVCGSLYGRFAGVVAGLLGGALGFVVHRFAWADDIVG